MSAIQEPKLEVSAKVVVNDWAELGDLMLRAAHRALSADLIETARMTGAMAADEAYELVSDER